MFSAHYLGAVYCVSLFPSWLYLALQGRTVAASYLGETLQPLTVGAALLLLSSVPVPLGPARQVWEPRTHTSICFSSSPIVDLEGCAVPLTAPGENTRSREDARRAGGDSSQRGAGSVPHQAAAWTGRQSPSRAGAQTRPHFTAKQSLFVRPVLPEQSPVLTMSFLWLSPRRASSSALSPMPGSLQQRPPAAPRPRHSTQHPCGASQPPHKAVLTAGKGKGFPGKAPAQLRAPGRCFSSGFTHSMAMLQHALGGQPWSMVRGGGHHISPYPQPPVGSGEVAGL